MFQYQNYTYRNNKWVKFFLLLPIAYINRSTAFVVLTSTYLLHIEIFSTYIFTQTMERKNVFKYTSK